MAGDQAQTLYARRKGLIEPVFGIIKEQLRGRRFLLRGLDNIRGEFTMLATAFKLRVLWRAWAAGQSPRPLQREPVTSLDTVSEPNTLTLPVPKLHTRPQLSATKRRIRHHRTLF